MIGGDMSFLNTLRSMFGQGTDANGWRTAATKNLPGGMKQGLDNNGRFDALAHNFGTPDGQKALGGAANDLLGLIPGGPPGGGSPSGSGGGLGGLPDPLGLLKNLDVNKLIDPLGLFTRKEEAAPPQASPGQGASPFAADDGSVPPAGTPRKRPMGDAKERRYGGSPFVGMNPEKMS